MCTSLSHLTATTSSNIPHNMNPHQAVHSTGVKRVVNPVEYEKSVYQKGLHFERPPFTFCSQEWEGQAKARMSAESAGYVVGNAGTGETAEKNRDAFKRWSIVPKRLVRTETLPDLSAKVLGHDLQFPLAIAPVGVQRKLSSRLSNDARVLSDWLSGIFNAEGEEAVARAAAKENVPFIMSTASSTSIEDVAKANGDGTRWYQLYWPGNQHDDITASMLKRAKDNGFTALIVTLDTYILGWRPSDMDNG
jgi:lactate 2-monooxygenase